MEETTDHSPTWVHKSRLQNWVCLAGACPARIVTRLLCFLQLTYRMLPTRSFRDKHHHQERKGTAFSSRGIEKELRFAKRKCFDFLKRFENSALSILMWKVFNLPTLKCKLRTRQTSTQRLKSEIYLGHLDRIYFWAEKCKGELIHNWSDEDECRGIKLLQYCQSLASTFSPNPSRASTSAPEHSPPQLCNAAHSHK